MEKCITETGKDKIMILRAICGKQNGDYEACKNTVNYLIA
jgi:hypothetical protein